VVTIVVDAPEGIARSFQIVDEVTDRAGLVTSEMVPALAAVADDGSARGGLRLARHRF
jgi:PII-like signaling protein